MAPSSRAAVGAAANICLTRRLHRRGHASSSDLMEWMFHPAALRAGEGEGDDGIFSGCAIVTKAGVPALVYHGVGAGTCVAFADDPDDEYLSQSTFIASACVCARVIRMTVFARQVPHPLEQTRVKPGDCREPCARRCV